MGEGKKKTVMILSAPIGSGHTKAAAALKEQLEKKHDVNIVMGDIFDFVPGFFGKSLLKTYFFLLKVMPFGYEFLYRWGDTSNSSTLRSIVNSLFSAKGNDLLTQKNPDAVICTHVTPVGMISLYKKKTGIALPLFAVVTDYSMHKWWIYDEVDSYIVCDKEIFADYMKYLRPNQQLWSLGIPVHEIFSSHDINEKNLLRKKLALSEEAYICLLSGGGEGLLPMGEVLKAWRQSEAGKNLFFVAICGQNRNLKASLEALNLPFVKVLGFVDNMVEYMKASDLIISKAGGITVTEAITINLPIILYNPLPGQENINAKYLLRKNLVLKASDVKELCAFITQASENEDFFNDVKESQKSAAKPLAAQKIIEKIYGFLHWQN